MLGGKGADTFVFLDDFGIDIVSDFEAHLPDEKIDLSALSEITGFDDLLADHLQEQNGSAVVIVDDNRIVLGGVLLSDLDSSNFVF